MKQFNKIWFIWLLLVCIWNFGWPNVEPIFDVLVAIILSVGAFQLKKYFKGFLLFQLNFLFHSLLPGYAVHYLD